MDGATCVAEDGGYEQGLHGEDEAFMLPHDVACTRGESAEEENAGSR